MTDPGGAALEPLEAGDAAGWLDGIEQALLGERDADVPCGSCTACCTASQFVHIAADEHDALDHIPAALLFPAPGSAHGHLLLGYDRHGCCPMLVDGACSIYAHRPRACRTYDCRVHTAAGVTPDDKPEIARRVRQWVFDVADPASRVRLAAVRAASRYVAERSDDLPAELTPVTATQRAVLAIELHRAFLVTDASSGGTEPVPTAVDGDLLGELLARLRRRRPPS